MNEEPIHFQKIAYWPNGLWVDRETAELAVELADFPSDYRIVEFPAGAPPELIDSEIKALLEGQTNDNPS